MRLYAITDRRQLPGEHQTGRLTGEERAGLAALASRWAAAGVEFIQLREKDLKSPELTALAEAMMAAIRQAGSGSKLLINAGADGAADAARTARAAGLHLPGRWQADQVGWACAVGLVSVGCHSVGEVAVARASRADVALLSPIFPTASHPDAKALGLQVLSEGVRAGGTVPVFALGGVTAENAGSCVGAGAAGVAAIRSFMDERAFAAMSQVLA